MSERSREDERLESLLEAMAGGAPVPVADAEERLGSVLVANAGTTSANGEYNYTGENLGYPFYCLTGTDPYVWSVVADNNIHGDSEDGVYAFIYRNDTHRMYRSQNSLGDYASFLEALQDLGEVDTGEAPVPTVSLVPGITVPQGARVLQLDNGFEYVLKDASHPELAGSWQAQPKVYRAKLTQSGENAPVAVVLDNTLGGTVVWTRVTAGSYLGIGTLPGAFPAGKTVCNAKRVWPSNDDLSGLKYAYFAPDLSENSVHLMAGVLETPEDENLIDFDVEILVYPA